MNIAQLSFEQLDQIEEMWMELNSLHSELSTNFEDHFESNSFDKRKEQLSSKDQLVIYAAKMDRDLIGYCVVSVNDNIGEIDSLYVKADHRGHNIGKALVSSAMQWLQDQDCSQINVEVAYGNEAALPFYEQFGFRQRFHVLQIKNN